MEVRLSNMTAAKGARSSFYPDIASLILLDLSDQRCSADIPWTSRNGQDGDLISKSNNPRLMSAD